ncbi:UbiH 2-polyprenyl-6-methoxyphenol hydroxylase and related FAD-dependent oxidoreductases [Rhabdaerophilaceae bacterium]
MTLESGPDIVVAGAGAAGLATAIALARGGLLVHVAGVPDMIRDDGRSAAIFASSFGFLDRIDVSSRLRERGWPLRAIRILDVTDALVRAPATLFRSDDIGQDAFGWNVSNADILQALLDVANATPGLVLRGALVANAQAGADGIAVTFTDESTQSARLLIGADGQKSRVRQIACIGTRTTPYPQVAITFRVQQSRDHDDISTEFHTREGPLTFVPAGDRRSAIVWMMRAEKADAFFALDLKQRADALGRASSHRFGSLVLEDCFGRVPLRKMVANCLVATRIALVGEAAHAFPPIGAQGLNLGFRDCDSLVGHVLAASQSNLDPGRADVLAGYARSRQLDVELRSAGVDLLNSALIAQSLPLDLVRAGGLALFNAVSPLRRLAMRLGGGMPLSGSLSNATKSAIGFRQ